MGKSRPTHSRDTYLCVRVVTLDVRMCSQFKLYELRQGRESVNFAIDQLCLVGS